MPSFRSLSLLATLASAVSLGAARPAPELDGRGADSQAGCVNGKAVYISTNAAQNAIVAYPIDQNGAISLDKSTTTGTGGAGAVGVTATGPAGPDGIFSQGAVTVAGNYLFTVNAGSNTVTMFAIDARDPTKLTIVGQPAAVSGDFPNTVGVSPANKLVCVGTTGAKAGVSCASYSPQSGIGAFDALRPFDLGQTTPPLGPPKTVSQVFFSADEKTVYATVKGDGMVDGTTFLASFPVQTTRSACRPGVSVGVAPAGTTSAPNGTGLLFGAGLIAGSSNLFVVDPAYGAVVLGIDPATQQASVLAKGVIANQSATCWVTISPATNTAFVGDAGSDRLVELSLTDASVVGAPLDLSANGDAGLTDMEAAGSYVYALSPNKGTGATVTVVNVVTKQQVQHASLSAQGLGITAQGLAILL